MKLTFSMVLAAATMMASCASTSDQAAGPSPKQMTLAEIRAEFAANSAQMRTMPRMTRPLAGESPQPVTPMVFYYSDSNGMTFTNYERPDPRVRDLSTWASRPFNYAQVRALSDRNAELLAELQQRTRTRP